MSTTIDETGGPVERFEMRANFDGLVQLLAKNLYPEPNVFVRELVQNAHDGIRRRQQVESGVQGRIDIAFSRAARTITFHDNGIGLDRDDIHELLSVIGATGTGDARVLFEQSDPDTAAGLIGQFGIGTLAAFVVADRITVHTRKAGSDAGWLWENGGSTECMLRAAPRETAGTSVTVHLSAGRSFMLSPSWLGGAIVKYCDLIPFPIHIDGAGPANAMHAPWHAAGAARPAADNQAYRAFLARRSRDDVEEVIPVEIDGPVRARGALGVCSYRIPDVSAAGVVDIYVRRMFVRGREPELLPAWAKFVRGVIDSPDLTPTAARDNVRRDDAFRALTTALGELIVGRLIRMATAEPPKFRNLCTKHHHHLNGLAATHATFFQAARDVLLFRTSKGMLPLTDCIGEGESAQHAPCLHYFPSDQDARQYHALADARGVTAVHAANVLEEELLVQYVQARSDGLRLIRLDMSRESILFGAPSTQPRDRIRRFERSAELALRGTGMRGLTVVVRSFDPAAVPAVILVSAATATDMQLAQLAGQPWLAESLQSLAQEMLESGRAQASPGLRLLLNERHALIRRLLASPRTIADPRATFSGLFLTACLRSPGLLSHDVADALHVPLARLIESAAAGNGQTGTAPESIELEEPAGHVAHR